MTPLRPCPRSPNCVATMADDALQRMDPLPFAGNCVDAQRQLEAVVLALPRARITRREPGYFAAEFRSLIFRFVDEAEFQFDPDKHVIHFRSGARTGYSDFGVNRARMRKIAAAFGAKSK